MEWILHSDVVGLHLSGKHLASNPSGMTQASLTLSTHTHANLNFDFPDIYHNLPQFAIILVKISRPESDKYFSSEWSIYWSQSTFQGPVMDPFESDREKEKHYADALLIGLDSTDDTLIEAEMEAALREYDQIGSELGIAPSCRALVEDPSRLTRWIIGEEKVQGLKKWSYMSLLLPSISTFFICYHLRR